MRGRRDDGRLWWRSRSTRESDVAADARFIVDDLVAFTTGARGETAGHGPDCCGVQYVRVKREREGGLAGRTVDVGAETELGASLTEGC